MTDSRNRGTGSNILKIINFLGPVMFFPCFLLHPQTFQFIPNICPETKLFLLIYIASEHSACQSSWLMLSARSWSCNVLRDRKRKLRGQISQKLCPELWFSPPTQAQFVHREILVCINFTTHRRSLRSLLRKILHFSEYLSWGFGSARASVDENCSHLSQRLDLLCVRT